MAITRADISGALKFIHANNLPDRRGLLTKMLSKEHGAKDVAKVLADLESYPEWASRTDLDVAPAPSVLPPKVSKARAR